MIQRAEAEKRWYLPTAATAGFVFGVLGGYVVGDYRAKEPTEINCVDTRVWINNDGTVTLMPIVVGNIALDHLLTIATPVHTDTKGARVLDDKHPTVAYGVGPVSVRPGFADGFMLEIVVTDEPNTDPAHLRIPPDPATRTSDICILPSELANGNRTKK